MRINRTAGKRTSLPTEIVPEKASLVQWSAGNNSMMVRVSRIPAEDGRSTYDYDVHLTREEVVKMIGELGRWAIEDKPAEMHRLLKPKLNELIKLAALAAGFEPLEVRKQDGK